MAKKRVHEIAKANGISSKEVLAKLKAAGIEAKVAASSVDEAAAQRALAGSNGGGAATQAAQASRSARVTGLPMRSRSAAISRLCTAWWRIIAGPISSTPI